MMYIKLHTSWETFFSDPSFRELPWFLLSQKLPAYTMWLVDLDNLRRNFRLPSGDVHILCSPMFFPPHHIRACSARAAWGMPRWLDIPRQTRSQPGGRPPSASGVVPPQTPPKSGGSDKYAHSLLRSEEPEGDPLCWGSDTYWPTRQAFAVK